MTPSPLHPRHAALEHAELDGGRVPWTFGDPEAELRALREGCALVDLSALGLVRLSGADTRRFANAQLSHNIRDLPVGGARHCVITDRKGRIEGMLDAFLVGDRELLMIGAGSEAAWIVERLDSYIIMDPLELEDLSGDLAVMSLQGPGAEAVLRALGAPLPERAIGPWDDGFVARNDRSEAGGFDLVLPAGRFAEVWDQAVAAGARPAGLACLEAARISRGLPRFPQDMGERAFIHEVRLRDRVAAFDKGCYIGQEVINRMETMGKVNRTLMGLRVEGSGALGAEVLLEDQPVGTVTSEARVGAETRALGVLRTSAGPGAAVTLRLGEARWKATVVGLPFDQ